MDVCIYLRVHESWSNGRSGPCFISLLYFTSQFVSPCLAHVNSLTLMVNSGHHKTISQRNRFEPKGQG